MTIVLVLTLLLFSVAAARTVVLSVGNAQLESNVPTSLSELVQQCDTFCSSHAATQIGVLKHRCRWVVAGSLLEALPPETRATFLQRPANALQPTSRFLSSSSSASSSSSSISFTSTSTSTSSSSSSSSLSSSSLPPPASTAATPGFTSSSVSILFLLHDAHIDTVNGGLVGSIEVALGLHSLGYVVRIALLHQSTSFVKQHFPAAAPLLLSYTSFQADIMLKDNNWSVIVATYFPTVWMALEVAAAAAAAATVATTATPTSSLSSTLGSRVVYFAQDYEPLFQTLPAAASMAAALSYVVHSEQVHIVSYSPWVLSMVEKEHRAKGWKVDCHPRREEKIMWQQQQRDQQQQQQQQRRSVVVTAMIRPATPRRAPLQTLIALHRVMERFRQMDVQILVRTFGCTHSEMQALGESTWEARSVSQWWSSWTGQAWPWLTHVGRLNHTQVHHFFQQSDIFVDLSEWQAYGFSAQEAMMSGVVPVVVDNGGVRDFTDPGVNAMLVKDEDSAVDALEHLILHPDLVVKMQKAAKQKMSTKTRLKTAHSWNSFLSDILGEDVML